ncbi:arsenate reductase (glutaredoxin) [Phenylobacterium immobile]|uniref:arsenate reductase (glutaredoxin) n=1 Tax=Phenylobacterium immobile TaxID=21 RepID=UPI000AD35AB1|nr:arsenate reductase (glutaredoxin) [Phenylobacterium immobile]
MSDVTLYHNPNCSTSRNTLALLREKGVEPTVVKYLETGWTRPQLEGFLAAMGGASAKAILRTKEARAKELGLAQASDEKILNAMVKEPILVERPIVVTAKGTVVARPIEKALDVL